MDIILEKCKFPNSFFFLIFGNICCRYTLELPHSLYDAIPMCTSNICLFNK